MLTICMLLLLLFLTFSVLVVNPKKLLYTVANLARGLLYREKEKILASYPPPPHCSFGKNKNKHHATHLQALHRYSVGLPSIQRYLRLVD